MTPDHAAIIERLTHRSGAAAFRDCAQLHASLIHHGALPLLGESFLAEVYRGLAGAPTASVWCARRGNAIVGFIAGCSDVRRSTASVLVRRGPWLLGTAVGPLFDPSTRRKVAAIIRYIGRRESAGSHPRERAELLAIAVDPSLHGSGTGRALVERFEQHLRRRGIDRYVVSTNSAETVSNAFYQRLGFEATRLVDHHDLVLQSYSKVIG